MIRLGPQEPTLACDVPGAWPARCFKGPGTSGKWRRDTECPVRREESEARGQVCRGGDRGTGGRCDCTGAVGWSEGGWHEPWCYAGKCYTGKYDRPAGRAVLRFQVQARLSQFLVTAHVES